MDADDGDDVERIRLTALQRQSLLSVRPYVRTWAGRIAGFTGNVRLVPVAAHELPDLRAALAVVLGFVTAPHARRLRAVLAQVEARLARRRERAARTAAARPPEPTAVAGRVLRFHAAVCDVTPVIWRRFEVEDDDVWTFRHHLTAVVGWTGDAGGHRFEVGGVAYGPAEGPADGGGVAGAWADEEKTYLHQVFPADAVGTTATFVFDRDGGWRHAVRFEGVVPWAFDADYPRCVAGGMAAPPEGCGGPAAYARFLAGAAPLPDRCAAALARRPVAFDPWRFELGEVAGRLAELGSRLGLLRLGCLLHPGYRAGPDTVEKLRYVARLFAQADAAGD